MEERSNKTIMCSVLFLDIVEYSKKSVAGQISLKDRFNTYLSAAISHVPVTDRIILDTGDGAAINFLGDVEDALKAALSLRESLLNEDPNVDHPLLVRMGVNLGPVRLVRDINGQPNIVGDGINVAQRVMGFADAAQILVSRSYYDAVSRLSPHYAGMFHYQGSRTDKHVREHEVYAIGYPGDKTTQRSKSGSQTTYSEQPQGYLASRAGYLLARFQNAQPGMQVLYVIAFVAPVLLFIALLVNLMGGDGKAARQQADIPVTTNADAAKPAVQETPVAAQPTSSEKTPSTQSKPKSSATRPKKTQTSPRKSGDSKARISVSCTAGTEVFVDGVRKGSVGSRPFVVVIPPGSHNVIVSHPSGGIYSKDVNAEKGRIVEIRPSFCK